MNEMPKEVFLRIGNTDYSLRFTAGVQVKMNMSRQEIGEVIQNGNTEKTAEALYYCIYYGLPKEKRIDMPVDIEDLYELSESEYAVIGEAMIISLPKEQAIILWNQYKKNSKDVKEKFEELVKEQEEKEVGEKKSLTESGKKK